MSLRVEALPCVRPVLGQALQLPAEWASSEADGSRLGFPFCEMGPRAALTTQTAGGMRPARASDAADPGFVLAVQTPRGPTAVSQPRPPLRCLLAEAPGFPEVRSSQALSLGLSPALLLFRGKAADLGGQLLFWKVSPPRDTQSSELWPLWGRAPSLATSGVLGDPVCRLGSLCHGSELGHKLPQQAV